MYLQCVYVCLYGAISHAPYVFLRGTVKGRCVCVCVLDVSDSVSTRGREAKKSTDLSDWSLMSVKYERHTCTTMEGPVMDGQRPDTIGRESEQPVHTSRVT